MLMQENFSLKKYNTFGIDVLAKEFALFSDVAELSNLIEGERNLLILGGGSNLLFTKNFDGRVLKNDIPGIKQVREDKDFIYLRVGAGVEWHSFVMHCVNEQLSGVENLALIPGNVGASPMQNIGAYGVEIKETFEELEAFHLQDKSIMVFKSEDCEFGYRESVFKKKYKGEFAILSVTFRLNKTPKYNISYGAISEELEKMNGRELNIASIAQAVINIRSSKLPDPKQIGNAGSFFKNPEIPKEQFDDLKFAFPNIVGYTLPKGNIKIAAGWMIEQCGWKGFRAGDAGCHKNQALVLVNYGKATGKEIFELSERILNSVSKRFNVLLEREVNIY
ncbi:MAG: UDP-N-acetylmuramate dehydrogenase [Chitinophagaceae bacterium]